MEGKLDTTTAPQLANELNNAINGTEELVLDLSKLEDMTAAGLWVLLSAHKAMNRRSKMLIRNVSPENMEIFEQVGFTDILEIE